MPLPIILGIGAAVAGGFGLLSAGSGLADISYANDTMKEAEKKQKDAIAKFEHETEITNKQMDTIGKNELEILQSFQKFADTFEKIQNRPDFKGYQTEAVSLPGYTPEQLKEVSIGAGVLLGGLGGAAVGTAGGFAAAGATTAAVMALGTASTGAAISGLTGVAATNATLAALGGGAIAAGGGGMALGSAVLGAATLGVGLLVGGVIMGLTGNSMSEKAVDARKQAEKTEKEVNKICRYLKDLRSSARKFATSLTKVKGVYDAHLYQMNRIVNQENKTDWDFLSETEQLSIENTALLVGLLYEMCQTKLVLQSEKENELNTVNKADVDSIVDKADALLQERGL